MDAIGKCCWAIAEGYLPPAGDSEDPALRSHETACILNAGLREAHITITIFFEDRDPAGPYNFLVPKQRTLHLRFNDLAVPERIPVGKPYASVIESDVPIVVQHTRLDARQAALALLSTVAYAIE